MSKYIIELKDDIQVVQKVGVTENGNAFVMNFYKDQLEELNSDYINEHYGELQDTAYQKGINDGSLDVKQRVEGAYQKGFGDGKREAESSEAIEQVKMDAFNKGMLFKEEKIHDAYQRGLAEGREQMPCDTCEYRHNNLLCADCKWTYGSRYKVDSIGVGDVVKTYNGITFVATKATTDGIVVGFEGEGNTCRFALSEVTKTGEHYNINEILGGLCDD